MNKADKSLIFPEKSDYPCNLTKLNNNQYSNLYRQLVESSASAYFETNPLTRYYFKKRFQLALDLIPRYKKEQNILDAGCGIGFFLPTLTQFSQNIWAIDYAKYSLQYTRFMCQKRKLQSIKFKRLGLTDNLPFPAKKFDLVICLSVSD